MKLENKEPTKVGDIDLTLSMADYDRTRALIDGSVRPERINLRYLVSPPSETFWRMLKFNEYDASEMSLSSFLIAKSQGRAWTAIPVFPFRSFFHTMIFVRDDSAIKDPADLKGKRFGLTEYQVTAAVWMRGVLQHEFDVNPATMMWYVERKPQLSHGGETGFRPPGGVLIEQIPESESLASLLLAGKIDAVLPSPYPGMKSTLNKTDYLQLSRSRKVRPLFADPIGEGVRYFRKHGFSHINHTTIIQKGILEKHPWVASSLFSAFKEAKQKCYENIDYLLRSSLMFAFPHFENQKKIFGEDPYPYGIGINRNALQTLIRYSFEQGLIRATVELDALFYELTFDT